MCVPQDPCRFFQWQDELPSGPAAQVPQTADVQSHRVSQQSPNEVLNQLAEPSKPASAAGGSGVFADDDANDCKLTQACPTTTALFQALCAQQSLQSCIFAHSWLNASKIARLLLVGLHASNQDACCTSHWHFVSETGLFGCFVQGVHRM